MLTPERNAQQILCSFEQCFDLFLSITRKVKNQFEQADWVGIQRASKQRLKIYDREIKLIVSRLADYPQDQVHDPEFWRQSKLAYSDFIDGMACRELAESFFNSTYCKVFDHKHIIKELMYVVPSYPRLNWQDDPSLSRSYQFSDNKADRAHLHQLLLDCQFNAPYEDLQRDLKLLQQHFTNFRERHDLRDKPLSLDVLAPLFFRNKGCYLIGVICSEQGDSWPFILAFMNNEKGAIRIDALVNVENEASILFGFARSYFMVEIPAPSRIVNFLLRLMPKKSYSELYNALGCLKHTKTLFYNEFVEHLEQTDDLFEAAPGIPGMVMSVFHLPSFGYVFKLIKDRFAPPKDVTEQVVRAKYKLVKQHDRIGRMADSHDFAYLVLPKQRFQPQLLQQLLEDAPSSVAVDGDNVTIRWVYVERRMTPLNLYLDAATDEQVYHAIIEYGDAIRELAAANIFPGDMLFKNFGITRHGRVIFYDYDEIAYMTECNFREIPEPLYPEQELAAEPWYSVGPNDVFPEEFATFLLKNPKVRQFFVSKHKDLLTASYWNQLKQQIIDGHMEYVFPYPNSMRFHQEGGINPDA